MIDSISKSSNNIAATVKGEPKSGSLTDTASTPSTSQTSKASQTSQASTLLDILKLLPKTSTLEAQVKSSLMLGSKDKTLLQQNNPSLASKLTQQLKIQQLDSQSTPLNTTKKTNDPLINALNNTRSISPIIIKDTLQNTPLFLNKLVVNTNKQSLLMTTVTPIELKPGDKVKIGLQNQDLIIQRSESKHIQQAANNIIKQILPQQEKINVLQQFIQNIQSLPKTLQMQILSKTSVEAITRLSQFTYSEKSLLTTNNVKQAISNSGVQLENKMGKQDSINNDFQKVMGQVIQTMNNKQIATPQSTIKQDGLTLINDKSISLMATTKETEKVIAQAITLLTQNVTSNIQNNQQTQLGQNATTAFMRLLGMPLPADGQALALPKAIEKHLKLLIEKTQARIQLNQLQSLGLDKPSTETRSVSTQQVFTEIPLRFNEQVLNLQISIQEREYYEKQQKEDSNTNKNEENKSLKQWQVFMSFDLPEDESLHTRLNLVNDTVSATLWAETDSLCRQTNQQINVLRDKLLSNGLIVEELVCLKGKPPQDDTSLAYNLIDIKT